MQKINSLKAHLQNAALNIQPEDLSVRIRRGKIHAHRPKLDEAHNQHHQHIYDIEVLIQNYQGPLSHISTVILPWVYANCPAYEVEDISFEADQLNPDACDLLITIADITETVKVSNAILNNVKGKHINTCPAQNQPNPVHYNKHLK